MRLIDADEIKKNFDPDTWQGEMMLAITDGLPTAYDVDKVVGQLIEEITPDTDPDTGEYCNNWVVDMQNEIIGRHIDIIRNGKIKGEYKEEQPV